MVSAITLSFSVTHTEVSLFAGDLLIPVRWRVCQRRGQQGMRHSPDGSSGARTNCSFVGPVIAAALSIMRIGALFSIGARPQINSFNIWNSSDNV